MHNPDTDAIVRNPFEDIEAIEKNEEYKNSKDLTGKEPGSLNETTSNNKTASNNETTSNAETNFPDNTEKPSYNYIVGIYKSKFEKLQHEQENKLYSLMDEAIAEYIKNE